MTVDFGPEYPKIHSCFKRDARNVIIPGDWSLPEFAFLADVDWQWTEKVDGTNIRLHWNGQTVTIGGRTDQASVPATLIAALQERLDPAAWRSVFGADPATVYGEGFGAKIQSGGMYRPDQDVIVFDVLVDRWWLQGPNVQDVAGALGFAIVPRIGVMSLTEAWNRIRRGDHVSAWAGARIEGYVGTPLVDLFNRRGERIVAKVKVNDWADYERRGGQA